MRNENTSFEKWWTDNSKLRDPHYQSLCAWKASAAHSAARIAELEGQVAMLREAGEQACVKFEHPTESVTALEMWKLRDALTATAKTAEQYKRRVKAQALEEAAQTLGKERNYGVDPYSKLLSMVSELRNAAAQAEGRESK